MTSNDQILERAECAKDTKARRVTNVAPGTLANISADALENGIALEDLEILNVPVFRYGTQITIHGRLPDFNPKARPGGYKAVFQNANGSVGVRYSAIDGAKKERLKAVARVARGGPWSVHECSTAFELVATIRNDLPNEQQITQAKALFAAIPCDKFFGCAYYARGRFGSLFVVASIGSFYEENFWPLCSAFFGIADDSSLALAQAAADAEDDKRRAEVNAFHTRYEEEKAARQASILATLKPISTVPETGVVFVQTNLYVLKVEFTKERGRHFYRVLERDGRTEYEKRKLAHDGFPWRGAFEAGHVFV